MAEPTPLGSADAAADERTAAGPESAVDDPSAVQPTASDQVALAVDASDIRRARARAIRAPIRQRRYWGYFFWGFMGLVIAVPELSAAFWPEYVPWPTISGTVGYLEYWHPWVSLIVVGVIAWWALHVIEFGPEKAVTLGVDEETNPDHKYWNTKLGWNTRAKELQPVHRHFGYIYLAIAISALVVLSLIVALGFRPDDEFLLGEVIYSTIAIFWILIPLGLAYRGKDIPFPTLFETFRDFAHWDKFKIVATVIAGGIAVLLIHLVLYPWPSIIPDLKDLHEQNKQQQQENKQQQREEKKENEPSPFAS
jgi:hypothetical protein